MRKIYLISFIVVILIVIYLIGSRIKTLYLTTDDKVVKYKNVEKFDEIIDYISSYYVDDVDWDSAMQVAIEALLSELDPHTVYISARDAELNEENFQGRYQGIGIQFDIIDSYITVITPIPDSPSDRMGLMAGDRIIKINGESAIGLTNSDVPKKLKGPKGTSVNITVIRQEIDEPLEFTIIRDDIPIFTVNAEYLTPDSTGYIFLSRFAKTTEEEFLESLTRLEQVGMKRLILDLRENAGGYLDQAVKIASLFIPGHKKIVYTKGRLARFNEDYYSDTFGNRKVRQYPLIILINHASASASEIVAGAIQDYDRGFIVGTSSFGKGLVQREFPLNDDSRLRLTISKYYTPSGRLIQRPYKGKKIEQYYLDSFTNIPTDSVQEDTVVNRPIYYTASGRTVYGGGGIKPDSSIEFVSNIESPGLMLKISQKRIFFELAAKYAQSHHFLKESFISFLQNYQVQENLVQEFYHMVLEKDIAMTAFDLGKNKKYIKNRLKSEIARSLWGNDKFYIVRLENDNQYQEAKKLFPYAEKIRADFAHNMAVKDR